MKTELYFKCRKCGYIFHKDNKNFVTDKIIQENLRNTYSIDSDTCEPCIEYGKWERNEYFT